MASAYMRFRPSAAHPRSLGRCSFVSQESRVTGDRLRGGAPRRPDKAQREHRGGEDVVNRSHAGSRYRWARTAAPASVDPR